jgi:predicted DCC family thiol-disulfide oxidoreductase YuxK
MANLGSGEASFFLPSGNAVLIYDAKCALCINLAHKAYFNARKPVEIWALSDPRAINLLNRAYPNGGNVTSTS